MDHDTHRIHRKPNTVRLVFSTVMEAAVGVETASPPPRVPLHCLAQCIGGKKGLSVPHMLTELARFFRMTVIIYDVCFSKLCCRCKVNEMPRVFNTLGFRQVKLIETNINLQNGLEKNRVHELCCRKHF